MGNDHVYVMDKLIGQCRQAYQARTPLIMVDTEEIELMRRLAQEGKLVDLLKPVKVSEDSHDVHYYAYVGIDPNSLELCENFFDEPEPLEELSKKGGSMSYQKPSCLFLLHLTQNSWNANNKTEGSMISRLRQYVNSYVSCQNISSALRNSCVLLYGDPGMLPRDLKPYTEVFTVDYPKTWEIMEIICKIAEENGHPFENPDHAREIALQMTGFSLIQVEHCVNRLLWVDGENGRPLLFSEKREELLLDAKAQALGSSGGLLQLYREKKDDKPKPEQNVSQENQLAADDLGGMGAYKEWADEAGKRMDKNSQHEYALTRGVPALKGVLLCGVPGCGKSEAAKILHRKWGVPMVRMDMDQLMGGLVGDSERNLRQALAQAEAMSPCILWIDELEKGFSGASSGSGDGGTFKRMFGRLLTWMQENTKPCFIFATANDISHLPPEFFRSGRFDALFAVYMPTNDECKEIFKEQMKRAERLRQKTAEEQGMTGKLPPLFQDDAVMGCFTDSALQNIMNLVMKGKDPKHPVGIKFLSGADIQKITTNALIKIPQDKLNAPIDLTTWLEALELVIQDPSITTQGSSSANLDKIAACYVRLMRENFAPVSKSNQLLFQKEYYSCQITEQKKVTAKYTGRCTMQQPYDRALFHALRDRIEIIASQLETNALYRVCE
ncbi:MAG: AAA family ATPase [Candidatus Onthomonas sp.]|nr:AAA family ATPase [Candidatus Onthomonas sp.]